ncbi:MAG TPA: PrpF domain-containing protein [Thermodesulfobacteriota bacterium]
MAQGKVRAVFMRGGTSKGIVFRAEDLPADAAARDRLFLAAMGSPDPNGRQLDGMGGGISSLSKVCIVGPPSRPDADVDYTFGQVSVREASVDYSGNCGNMSSAIGPFSVDEGIVRATGRRATVRIHNTNTRKIIVARFDLEGDRAAVDGDFVLDGVAGAGAPIRLDFTDPGGAKTGRLLPTGRPVDVLEVAGVGRVRASLVDAANPCVFVAASDLGCDGSEAPEALERDRERMARLEAIRCAASVAMGLAPDPERARAIPSVPKVAMVAAPRPATTLSGRTLAPEDMDIAVRMISIGQPHRAVPLTGAMCLAVATRIEGSLPHELAAPPARPDADIRIAHASGVTVVNAAVTRNGAGGPGAGFRAEYATVYRTARRLFEGYVFYRRSGVAA